VQIEEEESRMSGRLACCLVAGVIFLVMSAVGLAGAQDWSGYIAAPDGTLLATDVYLPVGEGPWPVVLTRTPYDKLDPGHYPDWCRILSQHGYACVAQDCRGRYASAGTDTVFRDAGPDGRATVVWITSQSWCNGAVASVGGSAMGITGYAMAASPPPGLKCMVAAVASPDLYHHVFSQGGAVRWSLASNWLAGQGSLHALDEFLDHRLHDDWWQSFDFLPTADSAAVKVLHFGGWFDMYIQGPLEGYSHTRLLGGDQAAESQYLIMGPWQHFTLATGWMAQTYAAGHTVGELTYPDNGFPGGWPFRGDEWQMLLDWLGYCLQDQPTSAADWPSVRVYLMGAVGEEQAPGNRWVDLDQWPPVSRQGSLYLSADSQLSWVPPEAGQQLLEIDPDNPVPTLGGPNHFGDLVVAGRPMGIGPYDQRQIEARSDLLSFTGPVLRSPLTIMGRVRCRIWLQADTPDLDLSVRLTDVYPDGRSMLMLDGIQRARMRCGDDQECFLEPGEPTEIEVDLWSTALVVNAGHRIRVDVAGSNYPRFEVNPNDGGDLTTGTPIVARPALLFGEQYPSALLLPVIDRPRRPARRVTTAD
jgi:predicted acyl esterase